MNYTARYTIFFIIDSLIVLSAIFISYFLLYPTIHIYSDSLIILSSFTLLISHHVMVYFFQLYNRIWSLASVRELLTIAYAVTTSVVAASIMQLLIKSDIYFRVMVITWLLHIVLIGGSRFLLRILHERTSVTPHDHLKRVLIIGAGRQELCLFVVLRKIHLNIKW